MTKLFNTTALWSIVLLLIYGHICSCDRETVPVWDSENSAYAEFTSSSDLLYSFAGQPEKVTEATVEIPLTIHLDPVVDGHEIWVEINRQPSSPLTRFEYSAKIPVCSGEEKAILPVKVSRSENLADEADTIEFRICDSPSVKAGMADHRTCRVVVTDFFVKPEWWGNVYDSYYNPVGVCNQLKLELWFEVFGNFDDPRHGSRAWTGADAVIALALINKASMDKYGKMFHELLPTDQPLNRA